MRVVICMVFVFCFVLSTVRDHEFDDSVVLNLCAPKSLSEFRARLLIEFNKKCQTHLSGDEIDRLNVFWKPSDNPNYSLEDMGLLFKRKEPAVDDGLWANDASGSIRLLQWIAFRNKYHDRICHVVLMATRPDVAIILCRALLLNGTNTWSG